MGKVRPERVKRIARELMDRFPDKFTADFEANKEALKTLIKTSSTKLRNRIAGYITRLMRISQAAEGIEGVKAENTEIEETGSETSHPPDEKTLEKKEEA